MTQDFERRFAEALADLDQGNDIDALLAQYPDEVDELASLLEAATYARQMLDFFEPPSTAGLAAGRRRMLEAAARKRSEIKPSWRQSVLAALGQWLGTPARGLATAALLLALFLAAGGATVVAAADSLPGDPLYGVKRTSERVRLALATDPAARAALHVRFNRERQAEAQTVAGMGRRAQLQFEGVLERRTDGTWIVDGIELTVEPGAVEGEPVVGSTVVVDVVSPGDGTLRAEHMTVHGGPHRPVMPGRPSPTDEPDRPTPSATPTAGRGMPATETSPTEHPTPTHEPAMPMPTEDMRPGQRPHGPQPQPTYGGPMTVQATASPQATHGHRGPEMGQATATPVPAQGPEPTQEPPTAPAPTDEPEPTPTHHGPMMPHPTHTPGSGHPGGGGGHHG
ncbi:MAG: DUF5667 domain-containing protein [Anaerolineae bacterium]